MNVFFILVFATYMILSVIFFMGVFVMCDLVIMLIHFKSMTFFFCLMSMLGWNDLVIVSFFGIR